MRKNYANESISFTFTLLFDLKHWDIERNIKLKIIVSYLISNDVS